KAPEKPSTLGRTGGPTKLSPLQSSASNENTAREGRVPGPSPASPPIPPRYWLRSNSKDLALFFRQMHAMLHAGTSLGHALNTMATNAPNAGLRTACEEMRSRVSSGQPWSELMKSYPGIFSPLAT